MKMSFVAHSLILLSLFIIPSHIVYGQDVGSTTFPLPDTNPTSEQLGTVPDMVLAPSKEMIPVPMVKTQLSAPIPASIHGSVWVAQGPAPILSGQVENLPPDNTVSGAVHVVLPQPGNADILYAAGVNGGVWKTTNATAASPSWVPLTDSLPSLSIGALEFDYNDPTFKTLIAGIGRFSSFGRDGSGRIGLFKTTDGGTNWTHYDGNGMLNDKNISGIAVRGNIIVLSVDYAEPFSCNNTGIFRSTDGGSTFSQLDNLPTTPNGMPRGVVFDFEGHPNSPTIMYSAVKYANFCDGGTNTNGIYKSSDSGASWTKISNPAIESLIVDNQTSNIELSVFDDGLGTHVVYAAILNYGQLINGGVFRTANGGSTWTQMDVLQTNTPTPVGSNPRFKPDAAAPGSQGSIHFSIEADPASNSIVYVGGDRQPNLFEEGTSTDYLTDPYFPNWVGANDYSGRLFRGNSGAAPGSQWLHLTHVKNQGFSGGGTGSSSAPHADSREMAFDANKNLIEGDDGGINRRTLPENNNGDWRAINGNLQVTEIHDIAYDSLSNIIISGNQDTGTTYQSAADSRTWRSYTTGDGGDVAVDNVTLAGSNKSIRYSSYQNLAQFSKSVWKNDGTLAGITWPTLTGFSGSKQFNTPVTLNRIQPTRMVIGGLDRVHESFDQGDTVTPLTPDIRSYAMDFGGTSSSGNNADVLWVAGRETGPVYSVRVRTGPGTVLSSTAYAGAIPYDIVMDPGDWRIAYVVDSNHTLWKTSDSGASFTDVTGNLNAVGALRSLEYFEGTNDDYLIVGSDAGVFIAPLSDFSSNVFQKWNELGNNLPNAPVYEIVYNVEDDVLIVGTLGRGAWKVLGFSAVVEKKFPWPTFLPAMIKKTTK